MSSSDRLPYTSATSLDQSFLDFSHDNLVNQLEMVAEIGTPTGTIFASDRNKYVGDAFYEALVNFPPITRTLGDWLSPTLEFSSLKLEIANADGRFNSIMPGGASFDGMANRPVEVKIGLRDVAATYTSIFKGFVTEIGGFKRSIKSFTIIARNQFDQLSVKFPTTVLNSTDFPDIESEFIGTVVPYIWGDWSTNLNPDSGASIPAFPINTAAAAVQAGTSNLGLVVSENANQSFDSTKVALLRSQTYYVFPVADITNVNGDNNQFEIKQGATSTLTIDGNPFIYASGDKFFVVVNGVDLGGGYSNNIVWQARDILITHGGLTSGDFDTNWETFRDKASPVESAISTIAARLWIQKPQSAITQALSLLEQVRLEAFVDRNLKFKIRALHFDEFEANPTFTVRNWDVARNSLKPTLSLRNNINRTQGFFNFLPDRDENFNRTNFLRNSASITQLQGKIVEKSTVFPNLIDATVVTNQAREILKLASAFFENIDVVLTWRSLLLDLGDFVALDVKIGATQFDKIPALIRLLGYDAKGLKIPVKVWSFQQVPFDGFTPTGGGIVGGSTATITEE